jgi:hypothetical protein
MDEGRRTEQSLRLWGMHGMIFIMLLYFAMYAL